MNDFIVLYFDILLAVTLFGQLLFKPLLFCFADKNCQIRAMKIAVILCLWVYSYSNLPWGWKNSSTEELYTFFGLPVIAM